jgi:hypothetical protein
MEKEEAPEKDTLRMVWASIALAPTTEWSDGERNGNGGNVEHDAGEDVPDPEAEMSDPGGLCSRR